MERCAFEKGCRCIDSAVCFGRVESPLIPHLMGLERSLRGHEEIRVFWEKLLANKPEYGIITELAI